MTEETERITTYDGQLKHDFPELGIEKVELIGTGWHHDAVEVNDSIIFRIPRGVHDLDAKSVHFETEVLKLLAGKLPVKIPDPKYIAPDSAYFGYPKLEGEILNNLLPDFNEEDKANFREDWVNIVVSIHHNLSVEVAHQLGVPTYSEPGTDIGATAHHIFILPNISDEVLNFSKRAIEEASELDPQAPPQAAIHQDLQAYNLLVDPKTKRLTGVIDWTDICIGPLAREFSVWESMQSDQIKNVADLYHQKTGIAIDVKQARLWKHLEEISDLAEQIESGDIKGANYSTQQIMKWIASGS